jgi:hypothetical protein
MSLTYVRQKHEYGCAIASLAMVTSIPYDDIEREFLNDFNRSGVKLEHIKAFLQDHGQSLILKQVEGYLDIASSNKHMLVPFAPAHIVCTSVYVDAETTHSVVMDENGELLDPSDPDRKDWSKFYYISSVMGCWPDNTLFEARKK